jgi:hypothetical protein
MMGKSVTHLVRLSAILQSLENAFQILTNLKTLNKLILTDELKQEINNIVINKPDIECINLNCIQNAKKLISYYNLHRLTMAGYKVKTISSTNESTVDYLVNSNKSLDLSKEQSSLMKYIMEFDGSIINATVISQKKRVDIKSVQIAFNKLEIIQLGKIIISSRGAITASKQFTMDFEKLIFDKIRLNLELIPTIQDLEIDLNKLKKSYTNPNIIRKIQSTPRTVSNGILY